MRIHYRPLLLLAAAAGSWAQPFNFLPGSVYPAGNGSLSIATGDFNGDTKPDLAVGNISSGTISVYLGNGAGGFTAVSTVTIPGCLVSFVATVTVLDAVLAPGSAGLYQIAIQLPASVPVTGAAPIQASVGGVMSLLNTSIYVSAQ